MPKEFIVAIELGSSKMTGIAGQKNLDGSITVLATVEEDSSSCIRKGVIYNIDKTCQCLTNIIKKLKNILKQDITQVYVGVGGRSIRSIKNVIVKDLPGNTIISQEMINELMDINRNMTYPDQEILDAATQEYKIDNQYQIDPVGIQCNHLEGIFLNILWRKNFYNNINTCFENANIPIAEMYLAPLAMADSVLTDSEKRAGCMLVDLGADTTTVSPIPALCAVADEVTKVHAICVKCGALAYVSHRLVHDQNQVLIGEQAEYEPLCRECYKKAMEQ